MWGSELIFNARDPIGRAVILKRVTWDLKISCVHPEINLCLLEKLVKSPYYILRDFQPDGTPHPTREEYVDLVPSPVSPMLVVIRAIIDHLKEPGEVVTAFISTKTKGLSTQGGIVYARGACSLR